jgi:salicylate hydroxylase
MSSAPAKFRIAISGGGIGGLSLAAFLCHHSDNILIDIYETKPEISTIGAGIAIWKRTWQTLQDIGLEDEVRKRNLPLPKDGEVRGPIFRKADQTNGIDFHNHMMPYGPLTLPRPILLEMLQTRLTNKCTIHTSKHLATYKEDPNGGITIHFEDGTSATTDILVGSDGVHSSTRSTFYNDLAEANPSQSEHYKQFKEPKWSGTLAYRSMVSLSKLKEAYPNHQAISNAKIWCGKTKHVVSHPFRDIVNMVCFYSEPGGFGKAFQGPWVADVPVKEVIDCYKGWESDLVHLVELIDQPSRWAIHVVDPLPLFVSGHVALLGDAAHAMTPHQGVGGGQAIEDAHILGRLLAHKKTTLENIGDVLAIYQQVRLPLAQAAAEKSWSNGQLLFFRLLVGLMQLFT